MFQAYWQDRNKHKNLFFLLSLILLIVLYPFFEGGIWRAFLLNLVSTLVLIAGIYDIGYGNHRQLATGLILGIPAIIFGWIALIYPDSLILLLNTASTVPFYLYITILLLLSILRSRKVTGEEISGALSVYLMIGISWGSMYLLLERLHPGSFFVSTHAPGQIITSGEMFYYSFITLATVGYGDIVPVLTYARSLAVLEAVIGVFFIAVLISRLVSLYEARK